MGQSGQTELITNILFVFVTISVVGAVLQIGLPFLEKSQDVTIIRENERLVKKLDEVIQTVASEGEDASRFVIVEIKDGTLDINGEQDTITISKETKARLLANRHRINQGSFFMASDAEVDAYAGTFNDQNVLILENGRIRFVVGRYETPTAIKLSQLVKQLRFIERGINFQGRLDFYLDNERGKDVNVTTAFVSSGYDIGKGEILAQVSSPGYAYNIHFVLETGQDFVRVFVDGVRFS